MSEFSLFREGRLANTSDMGELRNHYLQHVPDAYANGWERLQAGQEFGLCPEELISQEPAAIIQMLTSVIEPVPMVLHSLRAIENEAKLVGRPSDLFLWCNWKLPAQPTLELSPQTSEEYDRVHMAWDEEAKIDYATNEAIYENLIEAIRATNIDPNFLRIRPALVWEWASTSQTDTVKHCDEAILEDAEILGRSPDIPIIRLDTDTTFFRPYTLKKQIEVTRQNITPLTKSWMVFTRDLYSKPYQIPLLQSDQSEKVGSLYSLTQRMAEEKTYHNGGSLPYLDEVGTAMTLRTFARSFGIKCVSPKYIGESRAALFNILKEFKIQEQDAVTFLPDTRVGTSNRKIVRDIREQLNSTDEDRLYALVIGQSSGNDYRSYAESMELWRNSKYRPSIEEGRPFSPKEIFHMVNAIEQLHNVELDGLQLLRISKVMGKLGLDQTVKNL